MRVFIVRQTEGQSIGHPSHLDQTHLLINVDQSWPTSTKILLRVYAGIRIITKWYLLLCGPELDAPSHGQTCIYFYIPQLGVEYDIYMSIPTHIPRGLMWVGQDVYMSYFPLGPLPPRMWVGVDVYTWVLDYDSIIMTLSFVIMLPFVRQ